MEDQDKSSVLEVARERRESEREREREIEKEKEKEKERREREQSEASRTGCKLQEKSLAKHQQRV